MSALPARSAGSRPNKTPIATDRASVNARARKSTDTSASRGMFAGPSRRMSSTAQKPSAHPSAPPVRANTRLSVINCRATRRRDAPSASRIEISVRRLVAKESIRLATFADTSKTTNPTAPNNSSKAGRTPLSTSSVRETP